MMTATITSKTSELAGFSN